MTGRRLSFSGSRRLLANQAGSGDRTLRHAVVTQSVARFIPVLTPAFDGPGGHFFPDSSTQQGSSASARQRNRASRTVQQLAQPRLGSMDFVLMSVGVLLIFAITIINGNGRIFWEDETLGWVLLRDPSWHHMLRAWKLGADGGGIVFYVLGRAWFHLFGQSVLAFRLFTATTFGLTIPVLWAALRRMYSTGVVAFAVFNTLFFSPPLTMHYMEGRFYGLLMLGTVLAMANTLAVDRISGPVARRWYVCTFAAHFVLTGSHVLGVVYSAFLLLAMIVLDGLRGRRRPGLYLAAAASWTLLLFERTAMQATARVGKPHFWTTAPHFGQVLGAYSVFSSEILTVLLLLTLTAIATLPRRAARATVLAAVRERLPLYVTAGCLLLVPLALLLEGTVGTWLFTDRYLQPVALGVVCLTAELVWLSTADLRRTAAPDGRSRMRKVSGTAFAVAFAAALLFWVFRHEAGYTPSVPDFTPQLTAHVPVGLPVVVEDAFTFTELMSQPAGEQRPYTFLLDWAYAMGPQAPRMEVTQYHLMQNWKLAGYFPGRIQQRKAFLEQNERFLVVSNSILGSDPAARPETGNPLLREFARDPAYHVERLFTLDRLHHDTQRDTVWLVSRAGTRPAASLQAATYCLMSAAGTHCR